jgi:hypothetical protein
MLPATLVMLAVLETASYSAFIGKTQATALSSQTTDDGVWQIFDALEPSLEKIDWFEEGLLNTTPTRTSDGRWSEANCNFIFANSGYVFASFTEIFNWTAVNASLGNDNAHPTYSSFQQFRSDVITNLRWWMEYSWGIDISGLGISSDKTIVELETEHNESIAHARISFQITNIPGFFLGYVQNHEPLLEGFDLVEVSIGNVEDFQLIEGFTMHNAFYRFYLKAPYRPFSKSEDTYTFSLWLNPQFANQPCPSRRIIQVAMPSDTEVKQTFPAELSTKDMNYARFTLNESSRYPAEFSVVSGPQTKDLSQILFENAESWVMDPKMWVVFGSLIALFYTALRGNQLWTRRKTYYRLYRSLVTAFDRYSHDPARFKQEMEALSKLTTTYFIEDRITDDHFDKLLTRRDDLLARAANART